MKKLSILLIVCFIATGAAAQYRPPYEPISEAVTEKRFQAEVTKGDPNPFWLNTTTGELWKLDPVEMRWVYLSNPRGTNARAKGTYTLLPYKPGEVLILNTDSGEAWWTDGKTWKTIKRPSPRVQKKD